MTGVGFICEGKSECALVSSPNFKRLLRDCGLELVARPIDAKGGGNLLPRHLDKHNRRLKDAGAAKIVILADLERHPCPREAARRIRPDAKLHLLALSRTKIESWFLADDQSLRALTGKAFDGDPEALDQPDQELKRRLAETGRHRALGHADMAELCLAAGFDLARARCASAQRLVDRLRQLGKAPARRR